MKKPILFSFLFLLSFMGYGQIPSGKIIYDHIYANSLENTGGENPTRRITVYLPPGYDKTADKYPVIYYLHGITQQDSTLFVNNEIDKLLDRAISTGIIKPVILVMSDQYTLYRGSFYTNSPLTGNWSDFTAKDVVNYIDSNYRSIPNRESRGIAGHSMGGHGAIKLGMLFPDVYSSVYALSPYVLGLDKDYGIHGNAYKQAQEIKTREELVTGYSNLNANAVVAVGRAFSPNPDNPPFYADLPYTYKGDSLIINYKVLDLWNKNLPNEMTIEYESNLKKLTAIKFDWGKDDFFTHIPPTCKVFSEKLKNLGINHEAEEYIGSHQDKVYGDKGRFLNYVLPFFDKHLKF
jgi:S-formylglutathione hydrolase FrmB